MKHFLQLSFIFFVFSLNAQVVWTGGGDGSSWDDPQNWDSGVPTTGSDVILNGYGATTVIIINDPIADLGSLQVLNLAYLILSPNDDDIYISGNLIVDELGTIATSVYDANVYSNITVGGNYYFSGNFNLIFNYYVPQIGYDFKVIDGFIGSCDAPTSVLSQGYGVDVLLGLECLSDGVNYTVTDINYTSAISWDGEGSDNLWNNPANWDPNIVPTEDDNVYINLLSGGICQTLNSGEISVKSLTVGDGNTLQLNGDIEVRNRIYVSSGGEIIWNAGTMAEREDSPSGMRLMNYGVLELNTAQIKTMENQLLMWNYGTINLNSGVLNIDDGRIFNIDGGEININGDNLTIGYTTSEGLHSIANQPGSIIRKTSGLGTSSVNLEHLLNYGSIINNYGTLAFGEPFLSNSNGVISGSGSFQFPEGYVFNGDINPGNSPGTLTFIGDFVTASTADFNIEIDGPNANTEHDQVIITGDARLEGTINVQLGYLPPNDASFEIVVANTISLCDFPAQVTTIYNGTNYTFDVVCFNNKLYLNGPGATLSTTDFNAETVSIYPNPTENQLNLKLQSQHEGVWQLYNHLGQQVLEGEFRDIETIISTRNLASGIYVLQIKDKNKATVMIKKIVKN